VLVRYSRSRSSGISNHGIEPETNKNRLASAAPASRAGDIEVRVIPGDAASAT
jgi:hypothetical protein